ncbi:phage virion morphogenesis protein [Gallibacterium anatis]|uniref:phage virion morphogenesis protein n=1 Tax=Gallibacterium anatis TaxID=750 RepID=UPI0039FCCAB0
MHLEFKADTKEIQNMFRKLSQLGKTDGLTRKIANVLWEEAEDAFDNERSPEGEKWETLKEPYKSQRYKKGYTGTMLQVTGDLAASLNIDYGDNFSVIGAQEPYGQYHQAGTSKMAARPFLGLSDDGVEEIKHILTKALKDAVSD